MRIRALITLVVTLSVTAIAATFARPSLARAASSSEGNAVTRGARDAGHAVAEGARKGGHAVAKGARKGGHAVAEGARKGGHAVAEGARKGGRWVSGPFRGDKPAKPSGNARPKPTSATPRGPSREHSSAHADSSHGAHHR